MVTPLKFGFQFHFELSEIDQVPADEFPCAIFSRVARVRSQ